MRAFKFLTLCNFPVYNRGGIVGSNEHIAVFIPLRGHWIYVTIRYYCCWLHTIYLLFRKRKGKKKKERETKVYSMALLNLPVPRHRRRISVPKPFDS